MRSGRRTLPLSEFSAAAAGEDEVAACIRRLQAQAGYLADPHTACGVVAAETCLGGSAPHPEIVLATAHPAKFPDAMERITGARPARPPRLTALMTDPERFEVLPNDAAAVAGYVELPRARGEAAPRAPEVTKLANGLRVVSQTMPQLETVSLGVWVAAGARDEMDAEHGLSHFLEHMAFKGTARRSARAIAEEIEAVGGEPQCRHRLEHLAYFARVLKGDERIALDILADIILNSAYVGEELERERDVILQEIASILDSPDEVAYDLVHEAAYPGQAVGRPIIGTPASVKRISSTDLRLFLLGHQPARIIVAPPGDHARVARSPR